MECSIEVENRLSCGLLVSYLKMSSKLMTIGFY